MKLFYNKLVIVVSLCAVTTQIVNAQALKAVKPELEGFSWALFQIDEEGKPIRPIDHLHESALETDPTGREMRPRKAP